MSSTCYFYSEKDKKFGCFSNFFECTFTVNATILNKPDLTLNAVHSEQAIMWFKAILMGDSAIAMRIAQEGSARECKKLGRLVSNFCQKTWDENIESIADYILFQKFSSNPSLGQILKSTGTKTIAEAAPRDRIWGIGLGADSARGGVPWRGKNILGNSLMRVRSML